MTDEELLAKLQAATGEEDAATAKLYADEAAEMVLRRRYPLATDAQLSSATVPDRYRQAQLRIAVVLWARRGAEGETSHSENGVSRVYGDPVNVLGSILPYIGPGGIDQ